LFNFINILMLIKKKLKKKDYKKKIIKNLTNKKKGATTKTLNLNI